MMNKVASASTEKIWKWISFLLFFVIGLSSWILTNGLFLQIPILIRNLPESFNIAAYLVVSTQIGNILGLSHVALSSCIKDSFVTKFSVLLILIFAAIIAVLTALFWNFTLEIFGEQRSFYLWLFCTLQGGVGSLAVVVFFPFSSLYGITSTSAISTGMGASGLLASLISLLQSPQSNNPLFGTETFFFILLGVITMSFVATALILFFPSITGTSPSQLYSDQSQTFDTIKDDEELPLIETLSSFPTMWEVTKYIELPVLNQCYISIMNYILLGIIPYLVVGFPVETQNMMLFWNSFSSISFGAIGRAVTAGYYSYNIKVLTCMQVAIWVYLMIICFVQQKVRLEPTWGWISIVANAIYSFLYGYTDTINYLRVTKRLLNYPEIIHRATSIVGLSNQVGAIIGSVIGFILALYALKSLN